MEIKKREQRQNKRSSKANDETKKKKLRTELRSKDKGHDEQKKKPGRSDRVQTTVALWLNARVFVFEMSLKWHSFLFLMLFCSNSAHFSEI